MPKQTDSFLKQLLALWQSAFQSVKEVRAGRGTRSRSGKSGGAEGAERVGEAAEANETDWWDDVSHQAQRVAHVTAASAFASGGGEVRSNTQVKTKPKTQGGRNTTKWGLESQHGTAVLPFSVSPLLLPAERRERSKSLQRLSQRMRHTSTGVYG